MVMCDDRPPRKVTNGCRQVIAERDHLPEPTYRIAAAKALSAPSSKVRTGYGSETGGSVNPEAML
jgi:hypothetical protein